MVSVIIPVYNTSSYLDECIQSVVNQTYTDWECILVDDGSTDGSNGICDAWAGRDIRIKVIHQSNCGVSAARNTGIEASIGEYIVFIDSDDWVEPNYLDELCSQIYIDASDLIVCGISIDHGVKTIKNVCPPRSLCLLHKEETGLFLQIESQNLLYGPVNKLYCREIVIRHHIEFNVLTDYGEDLEFNFTYLKFAKSLSTLPLPLYHYRITEASRLSTTFREDIFRINYEQWLLLKKFHIEKDLCNEDVLSYLYERLWGNVYDGLFLLNSIECRDFKYIFNYVHKILSIPEIGNDEFRKSSFKISKWIRVLIMYRLTSLMAAYFYFKKA